MNFRIDLILIEEGCVKSETYNLFRYSIKKITTEIISKH